MLPSSTDAFLEALLIARPDTAPDQLSEVLATALQAGQLLLEHGASTARVEDTIRRLGRSLGAEQVEVFATPTGLFATFGVGGGHATRIQRIMRSGMDLSKIEAVLAISRQAAAGKLDSAATRVALEQAASAPRPFGLWLTTLASALCCSCTAGLFGGGVREIIATAMAAAIGYLAAALLGQINLSRVMAAGIAAAVATGLALVLSLALGAVSPATAMFSSILMLTPGVLIVSAISDLFRGDTIAGLARAAMAVLSVAAIAAGVWLVLLVSGIGMILVADHPPIWPVAFGLAFGTTIGFAMLFGVPLRRLPACALAGMVAYAANRAASEVGAPLGMAMFLGGMAVGMLAELLARLLRAPASIFSIPGIITLVPGGMAFRTMLLFAQGDVAGGTGDLVLTALLAGALAAGLGVVTALASVRFHRSV